MKYTPIVCQDGASPLQGSCVHPYYMSCQSLLDGRPPDTVCQRKSPVYAEYDEVCQDKLSMEEGVQCSDGYYPAAGRDASGHCYQTCNASGGGGFNWLLAIGIVIGLGAIAYFAFSHGKKHAATSARAARVGADPGAARYEYQTDPSQITQDAW